MLIDGLFGFAENRLGNWLGPGKIQEKHWLSLGNSFVQQPQVQDKQRKRKTMKNWTNEIKPIKQYMGIVFMI